MSRLRFVHSHGPWPYNCTAISGCDTETFVAVETDDGRWDGSAVCDNEQHVAEVLEWFDFENARPAIRPHRPNPITNQEQDPR